MIATGNDEDADGAGKNVMLFDTEIEQERNLPRPTIPETIRKAWGNDVAVEFISWLTAILRNSPQALAADLPFVIQWMTDKVEKVNQCRFLCLPQN